MSNKYSAAAKRIVLILDNKSLGIVNFPQFHLSIAHTSCVTITSITFEVVKAIFKADTVEFGVKG